MMQHQPQPHQNNHHPNGHRQHSSPRSSLHHTEPADSDDGGQGLSGDDGENDYDDHQESTRHGKRKRPISVSYVHPHVQYLSLPSFYLQLCLSRPPCCPSNFHISLLMRDCCWCCLIRPQVGLLLLSVSFLFWPSSWGSMSLCPRRLLRGLYPRPKRLPMPVPLLVLVDCRVR